jgi:hypothetical protein
VVKETKQSVTEIPRDSLYLLLRKFQNSDKEHNRRLPKSGKNGVTIEATELNTAQYFQSFVFHGKIEHEDKPLRPPIFSQSRGTCPFFLSIFCDKPEQNDLVRFSLILEQPHLVTGCFDPYLAKLISQGIDTRETRQKGVLAWRYSATQCGGNFISFSVIKKPGGQGPVAQSQFDSEYLIPLALRVSVFA